MAEPELDELELRHRIQAGIEAADELKKRLTRLDQQQPRERPKLRLIKGGVITVALAAGVEWLRGYRRAAVGALVTTAAAGGIAYVAPPVSSPPSAEPAPPTRHIPQPSRPPTPTVSVAPSPPPRSAPPSTAKSPSRTSPLRTLATVPVSVPSTKPPATVVVELPVKTPAVSITPTTVLPVEVTPSTTSQADCAPLSLNPLGVCLDLLGNP